MILIEIILAMLAMTATRGTARALWRIAHTAASKTAGG